MRDKLIELIGDAIFEKGVYSSDGKLIEKYPVMAVAVELVQPLADYLIANGVTFADVPDKNVGKWIPVSERLPEKDGSYLAVVLDYKKTPYVDCVDFAETLASVWDCTFKAEQRPGWYSFDSAAGYYEIDNVTHWMPLPEPPKEGE